MSLRSRVMAGIALIAVVLGIVTVAITRITENNLLGQVDRQLAEAVGPIRNLGDFGPPGRDRSGPGSPARDAPDAPGGPSRSLSSLYIGVVRNDRVETVLTPGLRGEQASPPSIDAGTATAAADSSQAFTVMGSGASPDYRVLSYTDDRSNTVVTLAMPLDSVDAAVADLIKVEAAGALVILAALGALGWWVIHLGVRPVKTMTGVATSIAAGDLSQRVPEADERTEAGEPAAALNTMLGNIETAFEDVVVKKNPSFSIEPVSTTNIEEVGKAPSESGDKVWAIWDGTNLLGKIHERGNEVWISVAGMVSGSGGGASVYSAVGQYAHNTGKEFIGDPAGFEGTPGARLGEIRRVEHLISQALR